MEGASGTDFQTDLNALDQHIQHTVAVFVETAVSDNNVQMTSMTKNTNPV